MAVDASPVVCLGDNCLDLYLPPVDRAFVGGSCLNVAVWLSRRSVSSAYVGAVGGDRAGEAVLAELSAQGVDRTHVRIVEGQATAITEIALEGEGERRFVRESYEIHEAYDPSAEQWAAVGAARHVHSSRIPRHLARLLSLGIEGASVSYDFSVDPLPASLDGLEVAFVPHDALPAGTRPTHAARELVERGCSCVVVTLGERGSVAATTEEAIAVDATPTTIVRDTCGAGDAFIAAFLAARLAGTPLRGCLDDGASAGAQVCSLLGAFPQQGVTALTTT